MYNSDICNGIDSFVANIWTSQFRYPILLTEDYRKSLLNIFVKFQKGSEQNR